MEENSVTRAISNVQKQSEIHNGKFKESFSELFADVLKSCRETGCLETQKENLLAVLEEASLVEFRASKYSKTLEDLIHENSSSSGPSDRDSSSQAIDAVSSKLHESLETLPTSCTISERSEQSLYQRFSGTLTGDLVGESNSSNTNVGMMMEEDLEVIQDAVALSDKCPITGVKMVKPMKSKKCNHVFSHAGLVQWFKLKKNKCPTPGCRFDGRCNRTRLYLKDFEPDQTFFDRVEESQIRASQSQFGASHHA